MAEEELKITEGGGKKKLPIIIAAVVVLLALAGGGYFFLFAGAEPEITEQDDNIEATGDASSAAASSAGKMGTALYVAMPRPFVFNVPGAGRDRLVQIKVQLMVRGSANEEAAKSHIPMIEGTLLQVFSGSTADDLVTEAGKVALRERSVLEVRRVMKEIVGNETVEQVLFTGFVMQ